MVRLSGVIVSQPVREDEVVGWLVAFGPDEVQVGRAQVKDQLNWQDQGVVNGI